MLKQQTKTFCTTSPTHVPLLLLQSQPDLRQLSGDVGDVTVPQRPLTPQVLCPSEQQFSVRDLKSRFESTTISDGGAGIGGVSSNNVDIVGTNSRVNVAHPGSQLQAVAKAKPPPNAKPAITGPKPTIQRQRSKSESESRALESQKPKSVLSKKPKTGERLNKPRKSVTFNTDVHMLEVTDTEDCVSQGSRSKDSILPGSRSREDTDSSSSSSPVEIVGDRACMLCHKQGVEVGHNYCDKCTYYMSKFTPT